jgi:hypothetical protein
MLFVLSTACEDTAKDAIEDTVVAIDKVMVLYILDEDEDEWYVIQRAERGFDVFQDWLKLLQRDSKKIDKSEAGKYAMAVQISVKAKRDNGVHAAIMALYQDIYNIQDEWYEIEAGKLKQIIHIMHTYGMRLDEEGIPAAVRAL